MKKQNTLDWLVRNLESWPKTQKNAPNVSGYRWCRSNDSLFLFDDYHIGNIEDLTIYKAEWEQGVQTNRKEWEEKIKSSFNSAITQASCEVVSVKEKKKIYIAGPMTGRNNFNRASFNDAANYLSMKGYIVLSPAILPDGLTQAEYMQIDLTMLQCCDAIFMLNDWEESMGANAEYALAVKLNMNILKQGN